MKLVILESPYAGDVQRNTLYARRALKDSLMRGEAPIASHLLYPQVLDDLIPSERQLGIDAGLAWRKVAEATVVYQDYGISPGMEYGIKLAREREFPSNIAASGRMAVSTENRQHRDAGLMQVFRQRNPAFVWPDYAMIACRAEGLGSLIFHSRHNCSKTPPIA